MTSQEYQAMHRLIQMINFQPANEIADRLLGLHEPEEEST
jgi:hypothetical protein